MKILFGIVSILIGICFLSASVINALGNSNPKWHEAWSAIGAFLLSVVFIFVGVLMIIPDRTENQKSTNKRVVLEAYKAMAPGDTLTIIWKEKTK